MRRGKALELQAHEEMTKPDFQVYTRTARDAKEIQRVHTVAPTGPTNSTLFRSFQQERWAGRVGVVYGHSKRKGGPLYEITN